MGRPLEQRLLDEALEEGQRTEAARHVMLASAARRQEAIFGLHATGMSIREIASKLGCSAAVIQHAVSQARAARPKIDRRENRVTFELHRAVAEHLEQNPSEVISKGMENIARMRSQNRDPLSRDWVDRWENILRSDVGLLKEFLLEISHDAEDMRQMSPFLGVLSNDERVLAIKKAAKYAA